MINLKFNIDNPWRTNKVWNILWTKYGSITENKAWEFNGYHTGNIINVEFHWTFQGDHAGVRLMIGLFGYEVELDFYDTRHWDFEKNTWKCYQ
jgi:hypothetical protein